LANLETIGFGSDDERKVPCKYCSHNSTVALAKDGKYNAEAAAVVAEATAAQNRQFDRLDQDRQRPDPKQRDLRLPSSGDHWSA